MSRPLLQVLFSIAALSVVTPASAYIASSIQLLENMAAVRGKLKLRDLSATLTAELADVSSPVEERIFLKFPERLRRVQERPDASIVYVEREGKRAEGDAAALTRLPGGPSAMLAALLMPRGSSDGEKASRMRELLRGMGVDTSITSLALYGPDVRSSAYVIGAHPSETKKPQVWIDRETFQPVRVVMKRDGAWLESRFLGYGSPAGGAWFPEIIENYRDGQLIRRARLDELRTNDNLPETLFDIP